MKYLHAMVRVSDVDQSLDFYCNKLGLKEVRRIENPARSLHAVLISPRPATRKPRRAHL